jgi:hypothetical protein
LGFFITKGSSNIDIDTEDDFLLADYISMFKESANNFAPEYSDIVKHLIDKNIDPST